LSINLLKDDLSKSTNNIDITENEQFVGFNTENEKLKFSFADPKETERSKNVNDIDQSEVTQVKINE